MAVLSMLALAVGQTAKADEVAIGDGTSSDYRVPINPYYGYSLTQQIYTAEEIGMSGNITSVSFHYAGTNTFTMEGVQIYMKHVDKEYFTNSKDMVAVSASDLVFDGPFEFTGQGWITITLDTPFAYDGSSNLLLCCFDPTDGYFSSSDKFYYTATTNNMSVAYYSDGTKPDLDNITSYSGSNGLYQYRCNIKFVITPSNGVSLPTSLVASNITYNSATLTWDGSTGKYNVEYKVTADADWTNLLSNTTSKTYTLTGLNENTQYQARVQAVDLTDNTKVSGWRTISFTTPEKVARPSGLTASNVTYNSVQLNWTDNVENPSSWQLAYSTSSGFDPNSATPVDVTTKPFTLTGLSENTTYYAYIRTIKDGDASLWCDNKVSFSTPYRFAIPSNLKAMLTPGDGSIATLSWTENGTTTQWQLQYGTDASFASGTYTETTVSGTPSKSLTGLTPETTYYARVRSVYGEGESNWSSVINFMPTDAYVLTVHSGTTTNSQVPIYGNWVDSYLKCEFVIDAADLSLMAGGRIDAMTFYLSSPAAASWGDANFQVFMKEVSSATISAFSGTDDATIVYEGSLDGTQSTLTINFTTPYAYSGGNLLIGVYNTVKGTYKSCAFYGEKVNGACVSGYSSNGLDAVGASQRNFLPKTSFAFTPVGAPTAPTSFEATTVTYNSATLSWDGSTGKYNVEYKATADADWTRVLSNTTSKTYTLTGLSEETEYLARVQGVDLTDNTMVGAWKTITFTTPIRFEIPTNIVIDDITDESAVISWISPASAWTLRYREMGTTEWTTVTTTAATYTITGLNVATEYEVQVQANFADGDSNWSPEESFTTALCSLANQGTISYKLIDSYGDGWNGAYIQVVHVNSGIVVAELAAESHNLQNTETTDEGTLNLCCGEDYAFVWSSGSYDSECSYIFYDVNGEEIFSGSGSMSGDVAYTMDCTIATCKKPTDLALASTPAPRSVELEWTPGETTQTTWDIAYMADGDADFTIVEAVTENPYTLTGLEPETDYTVKVRGNCDGGEVSSWSNEITFKTDEAFPTPNIVAATNITITSATLNWTGYQDSYNVRYVESYDDPIDYDFEDGSMGGWTTIDADGDGYDWVLGSASPGVYHNENVTGLTGHNESSDFIVSGSYSNYTGVALTPDNYLISPKVTLGGRISFWAQAKDATYCAEHFGVAVSTTDNTDAANFTTIAEWTLTDGEWGKYTVDLSPYADQNGYVAIRHFNCSDQFLLNIDDIAITLPDETGTEWTTLENVSGNSVVIEGLNPETTYTWQVQGIFDEGTTKWSAYSDFTTLSENPVPYDITVDAAFTAATISWKGFSDRYKVRYVRYNLFNDFESGSLNPWTTVRNDEGDEYTDWRIFDPSNFTLGITAHSGQYAAMSRSWDSSGQVGVNVDNWLISPAIPLDGSLNYWTIGHVGFGANDYPEHYDIYVSTATNDISDFQLLYEPGDVTGEWVKHTVDLSGYNGATGYIAFRHTDYDQDFFLIDDVFIGTTESIPQGEWKELTTTSTSVELTELISDVEYEYQIIGIKAGQADSETAIATFRTLRPSLDLNGDGNVDFADVATLANIVVGNISQAGYPMTVIDINSDGNISVADVTAFVNMLKAMP